MMKTPSFFARFTLALTLLGSVAHAQAPAPAPAPFGAPPSGTAGPTPPAAEVRPPPAELEGLEAHTGGLTAGEVSRRALAVSPSVKEKRAQLDAAKEKITQTMVQFFPRVSLIASYTRFSPLSVSFGSGALVGASSAGLLTTGPCPNGSGATCVLDSAGRPAAAVPVSIKYLENNYSVVGRLNIPLSDYILRLSDAAASSSASKESARLALEAEKAKVDADARTLYFNWLRARAQAVIAHKAVEQTRARLGDAHAAFTVGSISKAELLRIEALVANTEIIAQRSDSMVELTTGQLAIVMEDPKPAYSVGEGVPLPADVPGPAASVERLVIEAQTRRLEVQSVDEAVRALRRGASAQRSGALPRIDAIGDVTYASPNPRYFPPVQRWNATWSAGVQASWTIGDTFLNTSAANELEANAAAMEAKRTQLRTGIAQEVLAAYLDLERARAAFEKQLAALAAAEEAYRVTTDLFRAGRATGTDLIQSEAELLDAKVGDVNARIDLTIASIALRHATGADRPGYSAMR